MPDALNRPNWDEYLLGMTFFVAMRSLDPSTKHGCIVVDDDKTILSTGYNSPPRGCNDKKIPLSRPEKYAVFQHAEENAITNAARHGTSLKGSTFYITGQPCSGCFAKMLNVGAKRIIHGFVGSQCVNQDDLDAITIMREGQEIIIEAHQSPQTIQALFSLVQDYFVSKLKGVKI